MLDFKDWLKERWERIGYEECPEHLLRAFESGDPIDLPVGVIGEWNTNRRGNTTADRARRLVDPETKVQTGDLHESMLNFRDWLHERWSKIGYEECPEHLLKAFESGHPTYLPVGIIGEWNTYRRGNDPVERERRLNDPSLNAEVWDIHIERLQRYRCSRWQGRMYHVGENGGLYYLSNSGGRVYV
jgi:hypothetical protein